MTILLLGVHPRTPSGIRARYAVYGLGMTIAKFSLVALDCPDAAALAAFYQQITGGEITPETEAGDWVRLHIGTGADLGFQQDLEYIPPTWPDGPPQQAHLDFDVDDLDEGEARVVAIGAVKASMQPRPESWRVFLDPAGHPFCLVKA
jgi:predicted enzyme related to lactoylglutathione lyase